jgi:hypothetical protein
MRSTQGVVLKDYFPGEYLVSGPVRLTTIRGTSVELPVFEEDAELTSVSTLGRGVEDRSNFVLDDVNMRALELNDIVLRYGKINKLRTETTDIRKMDTRSTHFSGCDLGKLSWLSGKWAISPKPCSMTAISFRPDLAKGDTQIAICEITIYPQ